MNTRVKVRITMPRHILLVPFMTRPNHLRYTISGGGQWQCANFLHGANCGRSSIFALNSQVTATPQTKPPKWPHMSTANGIGRVRAFIYGECYAPYQFVRWKVESLRLQIWLYRACTCSANAHQACATQSKFRRELIRRDLVQGVAAFACCKLRENGWRTKPCCTRTDSLDKLVLRSPWARLISGLYYQ